MYRQAKRNEESMVGWVGGRRGRREVKRGSGDEGWGWMERYALGPTAGMMLPEFTNESPGIFFFFFLKQNEQGVAVLIVN